VQDRLEMVEKLEKVDLEQEKEKLLKKDKK